MNKIILTALLCCAAHLPAHNAQLITSTQDVITKINTAHGDIFEATKKSDKTETSEKNLKTAIRKFPIKVNLADSKAREFQTFPYVNYVSLLKQQQKSLKTKQKTVTNRLRKTEGWLKKAKKEEQKKQYQQEVTELQLLETQIKALYETIADTIRTIEVTEFYYEEHRLYQIDQKSSKTNMFAKFILFGPLGLIF